MWSPLIERLSPGFRCFCVDFPGFGQSFCSRERGLSLLEHAELCEQLMAHLLGAGERAVLIGQDVGGAIAELCAVRDASRIAGLVLMNSSCITDSPGVKAGWLGLGARIWLGKLIRDSSAAGPGPVRELVEQPWRRLRSRRTLLRTLRSLEESWPAVYERAFWRREIRKLEVPVLLLWGKWDLLNPPSRAAGLMNLLKEAYFFEDENCGHWPNLEDPAWVALKIREFVFRLGITRVRRSLSR